MPPPPNPNRRRRNIGPQVTELPSEGRKGEPPPWPLYGKPSKVEQATWNKEWMKPQATMWEKVRCYDIVARYVRLKVRAEASDASPQLSSEARQLEDDLGLSPNALRMMLWKVVDDELADARQVTSAPEASRRLRAVDPGAVAGG